MKIVIFILSKKQDLYKKPFIFIFMKIILFGPQGVGKGTYGTMLSKRYKIPLLGTGEIFRKAIKEKTKIGKIAEKYLNKGDLVPDEVTADIVKERIKKPDCKKGYILDGFPRTLKQAELLFGFLMTF